MNIYNRNTEALPLYNEAIVKQKRYVGNDNLKKDFESVCRPSEEKRIANRKKRKKKK